MAGAASHFLDQSGFFEKSGHAAVTLVWAMPKIHDELDREVDELRRSINATRTHGILYYVLLVAIIFVGFAIGYATHSLVGAGIILIGLALVAWREVTGFRARTTVLNHVLNEKMAERRQADERQKEFGN